MINVRQLILASNPPIRYAVIKAALGEYLSDTVLVDSIRESLPPAVAKPFDELLSALRE